MSLLENLLHIMRSWFDLMTGRTLIFAFSYHKPEKCQKAIDLLNLVCETILNFKSSSRNWKVNRNHLVICTQSILTLQSKLLNEEIFF